MIELPTLFRRSWGGAVRRANSTWLEGMRDPTVYISDSASAVASELSYFTEF